MTIVWHVDELNISYVGPIEVTKVVTWLDTKYPGVTATRGEIHRYLGMAFDFSIKNEVQVPMDDYITNILEEFPAVILYTAPSPAADHLFQVREKDEKIENQCQSNKDLCSVDVLLNFSLLLSAYVEIYRPQWRF